MKKAYFQPWIGSNYPAHRTVILSESTYDWRDGKKWMTPQPDHPTICVTGTVEGQQGARYFKQLTRALCESYKPTREKIQLRWNDFAYSVYVQESVGKSARSRPNKRHWDEALKAFPEQLRAITPKPRKLLVTGTTMWNRMPQTVLQLTPDLQAFDFEGELLWCLAVPHTANRTMGFRWKDVGMSIRTFMAIPFPTTLSTVARRFGHSQLP
jgi:hypothetical protein